MEPHYSNRGNPLVVSAGLEASGLSHQGHPATNSFSSPGAVNGNSQMVYAHGPAQHAPPPARGDFSLRRFLQIIFSRRLLIAAVFGGVLFLTAIAVLFLPPHYRSEAKLLVRLGRESVVIDPTARIGQSAVPMEGRDKEINSEIELLKSRKLVESVVHGLGARRILSLWPEDAETPAVISKAITLVEEKLTIEAVPESNVLLIQFESRDPELARDLIAKLIDSYLDERSDIYRERGDLQFFADQLADAREEQAQNQRQIQDLRDSSGVSDTTTQRQTLLTRINRLAEGIDADNASIVAEEASVKALSRRMGSGVASPQQQDQIARAAMLKSTIESLKVQKSSSEQELAAVNAVEVKMQKLQQESTLDAARVTQYAEAYEQTRIDRKMGEQKLSNISIAEPPILPFKPKAPSRSLLAIAGLFVALTLGLGSAFAAEAMDSTVRRTEDFTALGLQTVSIPRINAKEFIPVSSSSARSSSEPVQVSEPSNEPDAAADANPLATLASANGSNELAEIGGFRRTTILGAAIRPARPEALSPKMLASIEGVLERLITAGADGAPPRLIGVVAPRTGQGASTVALHLAVILARRCESAFAVPEHSDRVLLLDADAENGEVSEMAGVQVIRRDIEGARLSVPLPLTNISGPRWQDYLDVLSASMLDDKSVLAAQMPRLLQMFSQQYRHVVTDLPALSNSETSARYAGLCNVVVLVCKGNELRVQTVTHAVHRLRAARGNVAVGVLNQRRYPLPDWIYQRS